MLALPSPRSGGEVHRSFANAFSEVLGLRRLAMTELPS
jgi:hypothetical protein